MVYIPALPANVANLKFKIREFIATTECDMLQEV